ncbi:hypothetical protein V1264_017128 [Littorina saxatilis]|uniref:Activating signal cointegrator 1 complex subunit 2 n=1 Tax=Littorina saxatilis TaxID=31220 RepID=A0AAN9BIK8_9CAEN
MASVCGVPLDKKEIVEGSGSRTIPALHPDWCIKSRFVSYVAPPLDSSDQGLMGEWLERLQYICADLHWLLQLPHHKFWCQVIFDESLHQMLDSFLRYSPRPYDVDNELTGDNRRLHDEVTRLAFFTYLRMATYKESKENWLTPEVFGEIIYENFLFDIPKLLDLCALYGHSNTALLSKMVSNVFTQQPQYLDDLHAAVPTILQVFVNIAIKCGVETEGSGLAPQKLAVGQQVWGDVASMESAELQDLVLYLADSAITLTSFLTVFPPASPVLHQLHFGPRSVHFH